MTKDRFRELSYQLARNEANASYRKGWNRYAEKAQKLRAELDRIMEQLPVDLLLEYTEIMREERERFERISNQ